MFSPEQKSLLDAKLSSANVKTRRQGSATVGYIEGWHVIAEANRIFGFDNWTRETLDIKCVSEREREIGTNKAQGWGVTYICKARVIVDGVAREGCGAGHGIDRDLGQAHESAIKEAETDAMKRAFMTFGNPFGLALYDKQRTNVGDEHDESRHRFIADCYAKIKHYKDSLALREWWGSETEKAARRDFELSKSEVDGLLLEIKTRLETLETLKGKKAA
jgi:DNA repair and recombination protein RAD52